MSSLQKGSSLRLANYGARVEKAAATLPQTGGQSLFVVSGGAVIVTAIVGRVTTAVQAQATNTKLIANPDSGTVLDLCANVDLSGKEVGTLLGISGSSFTAAMVASTAAAGVKNSPFVVGPGRIQLVTAASSTGATRWTLLYLPLDDAAQVVSA